MPLNKKQERFCQEYIIDLNGTRAAMRAGYSKKTATVQAAQLLTKLNIQEVIAKLIAEQSKRTEITADFVLQSLKEVVLRCMQKSPVTEWDYINRCKSQKQDEDGNDIWEFDSAGANKALELLGKHLGIFKETDKTPQEIEITLNVK